MDRKNNLLIHVPKEWVGQRLDKALGTHPDIQSRSKAELLIREGCVRSAGQPLKASMKVPSGLVIEIQMPEAVPSELIPLQIPLSVLFEDEDLIVVNKPAGVVVHPSAGHEQDTLVNMLIAHTDQLSMGFDEQRPGIVHRLDRDTSGLLVVAKNDTTHRALSDLFKKRELHRIYHAVCIGNPPLKNGTIKSFLARHPQNRKKYASLQNTDRQIIRDESLDPSVGKWAVTHFEVLDRLPSGISYLKLKLETGRTHQIRVHLSEMGCPIIADPLYMAQNKPNSIGNQSLREKARSFPRLALHARELGFQHPTTGENLSFKVNWPDDLLPHIADLAFPKWQEIINS